MAWSKTPFNSQVAGCSFKASMKNCGKKSMVQVKKYVAGFHMNNNNNNNNIIPVYPSPLWKITSKKKTQLSCFQILEVWRYGRKMCVESRISTSMMIVTPVEVQLDLKVSFIIHSSCSTFRIEGHSIPKVFWKPQFLTKGPNSLY